MKFSEKWLREFVNPNESSMALAQALTMAGLEVEALEDLSAGLSSVVVAEVLSIEKHPNGDRLNVCRVEAGQAEPLQVVCGASNVRVGGRYPLALPGAKLPGMEVKPAKVRGVESFGMLCSAKELGLPETTPGLLELVPDVAIGLDLKEHLDLIDHIFTLKLTPNRSDCLSVLGVAREVAAITGASFTPPKIAAMTATGTESLNIKVIEQAACPRYCGRVIRGLNAKAVTPPWMAQRLLRSGLRTVNAIVDVTNYVMLELGQPLHAFDLEKIGKTVTIRFASANETVQLLNQQTVALNPGALVIADETHVLAVAGIMGGVASAVSGDTTSIFLESAFFAPNAIAGQARKLGLASDSAYRFERGVDFNLPRLAMERATQLLHDICGGVAHAITEVAATLPQTSPITLRDERAGKILGVALDQATVKSLLSRLQLEFSEAAGSFSVQPPSYRFDLIHEVDLIEELARLYGYDNIPATPPLATMTLLPVPEALHTARDMRAVLVGRDYQEIISYSFVSDAWERDFAANNAPIALQNPLAGHMGVMRTSLIGGLIDALKNNVNQKEERLRLFEIGRCFLAPDDQPYRIAGLSYGAAFPEQWGVKSREIDFFDVKADIEALSLSNQLTFKVGLHPACRPGETARVWLGNQEIGFIGRLHPKWQQQYGLSQAPMLFELELAPLLNRVLPRFSEIIKFPVVRRDIAVIVDSKIEAQTMLDVMSQAALPYVTKLLLFDMYRGKGIDSDKKSLAFSVRMQDTQGTLTDDMVEATIAQLLKLLEAKFGAIPRN